MRFIPFLIVFLLLVPVFVFAQDRGTSYDDCLNKPDADSCWCWFQWRAPDYCSSGGPCSDLMVEGQWCSMQICCMVQKISRFLFAVAAGLAIAIIIWAGITYMTAAGDENRAKKAKQILLYGIIGTAIVAASGYIIAMIVEFLQ